MIGGMCQLPRSLIANRLKYLISKLTTALHEEAKIILVDDKEEAYF